MRPTVPLLLCATLMTVACQGDTATSPNATPTPPGDVESAATATPDAAPPGSASSASSTALVLVTDGVPHPLVADASSRTVYYLDGDTDGSKCTGTCLETWPPVLVEGAAGGSAGLTGSVGAIDRADGGRQATFNGHPLYRYAGDAGVGRIAGHGVNDQWGQWHALAADGSPLPTPGAAAKEQGMEKQPDPVPAPPPPVP